MKIVFFDGQCPMCHSWVKRIIRWDKQHLFKFSPLEGNEAHKLLSPLLPDYMQENTIVYYDEGIIYMRSDAAIKIFSQLPFPCNLIVLVKIFPKFLRDFGYRWVANRRYQYGERYDACPLPPREWEDRFT